jgi:hypothetical protein
LLTFSIAVYFPIIVSSLDAIYPPINVYSFVMVCPTVAISSLVIIGHSMVNKLQGKQILTSYVLVESQWITFQYGTDCHIVIQQAQLVLRGFLWFAVVWVLVVSALL